MDRLREERELVAASDVDAPQGEVVPARTEASTINVMSGAALVLGDGCKLHQISDEMIGGFEEMKRNIEELRKDVEEEMNASRRRKLVGTHPKPCTEKDIDELKSRYKSQYQKHEIHKVDCNNRIVLEEVDVDEFVVTLTIGHIGCPEKTFRGENRQYFEQLEGIKGFGVTLSELIDKKNRVLFIRGVAGIGKSVLVKQLAYKWAKGDLFKEFKLCITFECRELNYFKMNEGADLKEHELINEFVRWMSNFDVGNSNNVLFIIDGLDELYDINSNYSIIGQLLDLTKCKYAGSKIIITGRPHVEDKLLKHGQNMGGLRKVEVNGLNHEQIKCYVSKFASSDDDIAKIYRAKDASRSNLQIIHVPQFLNSFCCVAILSEGQKVQNAAELYCWTLYLLLKQHADKSRLREKRIPEIFNEYSKDILVLSKICHELLSKNTIIVEENSEFQFLDVGKGKEFLKGLFVDVSDNFSAKQQFKHLTLMEFLSAVYVCTTEDPTQIIEYILGKRLDQVLLFYCQLISGLMYDGIIKELFTNAAKLEEIDCFHFLHKMFKLVRECVKGDFDDDVDESFELSIDIIMSLMNKDVIGKQFILSVVNELRFKNVKYNCHKLIEVMKLLIHEFECTDMELKKAFENVRYGRLIVDELNELKYAKYLASVDVISSIGILDGTETTVRAIRKEIDEFNEFGKCKGVCIKFCELQDEDFMDEIIGSSKLERLRIWRCKLNKESFINLCTWLMTSLVEEFELDGVEDIKVEWWEVLVNAIVNAKDKNNGGLALRNLVIWGCTFMTDEMKKKVDGSDHDDVHIVQ